MTTNPNYTTISSQPTGVLTKTDGSCTYYFSTSTTAPAYASEWVISYSAGTPIGTSVQTFPTPTFTAYTDERPVDWEAVRHALVHAREYLSDPDHWVKGAGQAGARRCLGEATRWASHLSGCSYYDAWKVVGSQISDSSAWTMPPGALFPPITRIQCFNDAPTTTLTDVLDVLDHSIKVATEMIETTA